MILRTNTQKKPIRFFLAACCGAIVMQVTGPLLAKGVSEGGGIHLQRKGSNPYLNKEAKLLVDRLKKGCEEAKKTCQLMMATPGLPSELGAQCALAKGPFRLNGGPIETVGQQTTDEYFSPKELRSARITQVTVLKSFGVCEAEVAEVTRHEIRHYTAGGYTRYELHDSAKKGRHWTRTKHTVDPKLLPVLAAAFLQPGKIKVSPSSGHNSYIPGVTCEVKKVSLGDASTHTSCLYSTGLSFPAELLMAGEFVSGGKVMWKEKAIAYEDGAVFPITQFMPPARDKVISEGESQRSSENATQKWCAKQKKKTGVDPCAEESGDD